MIFKYSSVMMNCVRLVPSDAQLSNFHIYMYIYIQGNLVYNEVLGTMKITLFYQVSAYQGKKTKKL